MALYRFASISTIRTRRSVDSGTQRGDIDWDACNRLAQENSDQSVSWVRQFHRPIMLWLAVGSPPNEPLDPSARLYPANDPPKSIPTVHAARFGQTRKMLPTHPPRQPDSRTSGRHHSQGRPLGGRTVAFVLLPVMVVMLSLMRLLRSARRWTGWWRASARCCSSSG